MSSRFAIIGDAMLDITTRVGAITPLQPDSVSENTVLPAGGGANVAVWLAALGHDVRLHAQIGDDTAGALIREALAQRGVHSALTQSESLATGVCVVLVDDFGERYMFSDPGANVELPIPEPESSRVDHVHINAYALRSDSVATGLEGFLAAAHATSVTTSIDLAAPYLAEQFAPLLRRCTPSIVFGTREEFARLHGSMNAIEVMKDGPAGVTVRDRDSITSQDAPAVQAIDTTGAGDAYAAGFLAHWVADRDLGGAMNHGRAMAAVALTRVGAWPPDHIAAK